MKNTEVQTRSYRSRGGRHWELWPLTREQAEAVVSKHNRPAGQWQRSTALDYSEDGTPVSRPDIYWQVLEHGDGWKVRATVASPGQTTFVVHKSRRWLEALAVEQLELDEDTLALEKVGEHWRLTVPAAPGAASEWSDA